MEMLWKNRDKVDKDGINMTSVILANKFKNKMMKVFLDEKLKNTNGNSRFINIGDSKEIEGENAGKCGHFMNAFRKLTKRQLIWTQYDIVSVTVSHDSKIAIAILQNSPK